MPANLWRKARPGTWRIDCQPLFHLHTVGGRNEGGARGPLAGLGLLQEVGELLGGVGAALERLDHLAVG